MILKNNLEVMKVIIHSPIYAHPKKSVPMSRGVSSSTSASVFWIPSGVEEYIDFIMLFGL